MSFLYLCLCLLNFQKVLLDRHSENNSNEYNLGFRWKNFKKKKFFNCIRKVLFWMWLLNKVSTVSVSFWVKWIITVHLKFLLKNRFIKFRFGNSYNNCIARIGYIHLFFLNSMKENSLQPRLCLAFSEFPAKIMLTICLIYHFWENFENKNIKIKKTIFCLSFEE